MRWMLVLLVVLVTGAHADAPTLRPKLPRADSPALLPTLEAMTYDRRGELHFALARYHAAAAAAKTEPEPWFNLAQLALRLEMRDAAWWFRYYLERAPNAPDRAQIERLVEHLQAGPPTVTLGGSVRGSDDEADAIVLLDGVLVGPSPATTTTTAGDHEAERFTQSTYKRTTFFVPAGARKYVDMMADIKSPGGNVVISGPRLPEMTWRDGDVMLATRTRFSLPRGKHAFAIALDRANHKTCTPVAFDVKSESELTYVRVTTEPKMTGDCFPVTKVDVQRLRVGP